MNIIVFFDKSYHKILDFFASLWMKLEYRILKVEYGSHLQFCGLTKISKEKNTTITIGDNCDFRSRSTSNLIGINRPCILSTILPGSKIKIGNNCGFSGTVIGCFSSITIGNNVKCGANTLITDSDWHQDDPRSGKAQPVVIEDNVWLGEGCKVLKGVTIGKNSVIGAGAVVAKSIPANVVAAGNPCKIIKTIDYK